MGELKIQRLTNDEIEEYELDLTYHGSYTEQGEDNAMLGSEITGGEIYGQFKMLSNQFGVPEQSQWYDHELHPNLLRIFNSLAQDLGIGYASIQLHDPRHWHYYLLVRSGNRIGIGIILGNDENISFTVDQVLLPNINKAELYEGGGLEFYLSNFLYQEGSDLRPKQTKSHSLRITNIYQLYFQGARRLSQQAELLNKERNLLLPINGTRENELGYRDIRKEIQRNWADFYRAQFFLLLASFEGFLNLVHEIYLDSALKKDTRLAGAIQREQLDIKVRLIPSRCVCFKSERSLQVDSDLFKKFQYLVKLRNDYLHANIAKSMRRIKVQEGEYSFWHRPEETGKYGLPLSPVQLSQENIDFVFDVIERMVEFVLDAMKPTNRKDFSKALLNEEIEIQIIDDECVIVG